MLVTAFLSFLCGSWHFPQSLNFLVESVFNQKLF
jgi:hypothetical protein